MARYRDPAFNQVEPADSRVLDFYFVHGAGNVHRKVHHGPRRGDEDTRDKEVRHVEVGVARIEQGLGKRPYCSVYFEPVSKEKCQTRGEENASHGTSESSEAPTSESTYQENDNRSDNRYHDHRDEDGIPAPKHGGEEDADQCRRGKHKRNYYFYPHPSHNQNDKEEK